MATKGVYQSCGRRRPQARQYSPLHVARQQTPRSNGPRRQGWLREQIADFQDQEFRPTTSGIQSHRDGSRMISLTLVRRHIH